MNLRLIAVIAASAFCLIAANDVPVRSADKVQDRFLALQFGPLAVEGYIGDRLRINIAKRLHSVDPADLIDPYRNRPGKHPWIGEHAASYVEAATLAWAVTGNAALKSVIDETVTKLLSTQQPDGYLGTYSAGHKWQDWDIRTHRHVLMALLVYHRHTGHAQTLEAARRIGDLLAQTLADTPGQRNLVLSDGHHGVPSSAIIEPMAMLFRQTGSLRYLNFCRYVPRSWDSPPGPQLISNLLKTGAVNRIPSRRTSGILANLSGVVELHRVTGDASLLKRRLLIAGRRPRQLQWTGRWSVHDSLAGSELEPFPAYRRGKIRRGVGANHLQRSSGRAASSRRPLQLHQSLGGKEELRRSDPGFGRSEFIRVRTPARVSPSSANGMGPPRWGGHSEPLLRRQSADPCCTGNQAAYCRPQSRHRLSAAWRCNNQCFAINTSPLASGSSCAVLVRNLHGHGRRQVLHRRTRRVSSN